MSTPTDRKYTESHEWLKVDGDVVTLGVTKFAVEELTDVTYAQMKGVGTDVDAGGPVGEIESVKATSDVYSAVPGEIVEVNGALDNDPGLINTDPYGAGWLVKIKASDLGPLESLMDAATYDASH
ncbi:MAG: glycine cleavage system protein GcvH [Phycisphaerales bacterium]|nr:MAG: glycine cleavage system protein GcvH [Phycisphaerales bacterium]